MTRELVPAGSRELTRDHIRFYRAVMDGVEMAKAWATYLAVDGDYQDTLAKATLGWVRQALIQEALDAGQPALVGLFRREPWRVKTSTTTKPTLAEFSERFADAGDWSEVELQAMWKEEYGETNPSEARAAARRERLNQRLRQALQLLERATRRSPAREDAVERWLAPNLAKNLAAAGLASLGAVADALTARTNIRWKEVPGVGDVWARRLQEWFDEHGLKPHPPALPLAPPPPPANASRLVPLERFELPFVGVAPLPSPTGSAPFSQAGNALGVQNDRQAIESWLKAKASNANTLRSYRKNAERLLLWCYLERRRTFSQLTVDDATHYRSWLENLGRLDEATWIKAGWRLPASEWIGKRAAKRDTSEWRPFDGPLSPDSVNQDLLTIRSLFKYLKEFRYLQDNIWDALGKTLATRIKIADATEQFVSRSFTDEEWRHVVSPLSPDGPELERRLLLVLWLGFGCGLRAREMLSLKLGSIRPGREKWRLKVLGKGNKTRLVPLTSPTRLALLGYLDSVKVSFDKVIEATRAREGHPTFEEPLLRSRRGRRGGSSPVARDALQYTQLYDSLKNHLKARAAELAASNPEAAAKFRDASTHWLRHTCATLALKNGVPLPGVQKLLGHTTLNTTSTYVTEDDEALGVDMERFTSRFS